MAYREFPVDLDRRLQVLFHFTRPAGLAVESRGVEMSFVIFGRNLDFFLIGFDRRGNVAPFLENEREVVVGSGKIGV